MYILYISKGPLFLKQWVQRLTNSSICLGTCVLLSVVEDNLSLLEICVSGLKLMVQRGFLADGGVFLKHRCPFRASLVRTRVPLV